MKKKLLGLVCLLFIFGLMSNITLVKGGTKYITVSTVASKDTYVNSYHPTSNYGGQNYLFAGFYYTGDILESYLFFSFEDKPDDWVKAEISMDIWGVDMTMNLTVSLIEEDWNEYTMTYIEKPTAGPFEDEEVITYLLITSSDIYKFDISDYVQGRDNISVCLYIEIENYVDDYIYITSREGYYSSEDAPQLIWTYPETTSLSVISPTSTSSWRAGTSQEITWTSEGSITNVDLDIYKGGVLKFYLDGTPNDGSVYWELPTDIESGTDWRIRISDSDDPSTYDYSDYFEILPKKSVSPSILGYLPFFLVFISFGCIIFLIVLMRKRLLIH